MSVAVIALVVGFVANSASIAALATAIGGLASFLAALSLNLSLWSPSPYPSDLLAVRGMIFGATVLLSSGVGFISSGLLPRKPKEPQKTVEAAPQPEAVKEQEKTQEQRPEPAELGMKICKFCQNVIPTESVFCPMCGVKLVEDVE